MESPEIVGKEASMLKAVAHLLMQPQVMISAFPHAANERDDIATSGRDYSIEISRVPSTASCRASLGSTSNIHLVGRSHDHAIDIIT